MNAVSNQPFATQPPILPMPAQPRPAWSTARLLLLPGMLSSPREFGMVTSPLRLRGIRHEAIAIAGYSDADGRVPVRWQQWVDSAHTAIAQRALAIDEPLVLGGLCVGGLLAAAVAMQGRVRVDGLILMSPTLVFDGWGMSRWLRWRHLAYAPT